jgi:putative ABC transport system permease protein
VASDALALSDGVGSPGRPHALELVRMFVDEGLVLTVAGLALGGVGAFVSTRLMTGPLFGVTPTDSSTSAGIALLMGVVALAACYVPARRAANVDPLVALRHA